MKNNFPDFILKKDFIDLPKSCFFRIMTNLKSVETDMDKLLDFILQCPMLTYMILRFANSDEFAFSKNIKLISEALTLLEPTIIMNYLLSFKESTTRKTGYSICKKTSAVINKINQLQKDVLNGKQCKNCEEIFIKILLTSVYDVICFHHIHNFAQSKFSAKKDEKIAELLEKSNFPEEYVLFFSSVQNLNTHQTILKRLISLSFLYVYIPYPNYKKIIESDIPELKIIF